MKDLLENKHVYYVETVCVSREYLVIVKTKVAEIMIDVEFGFHK